MARVNFKVIYRSHITAMKFRLNRFPIYSKYPHTRVILFNPKLCLHRFPDFNSKLLPSQVPSSILKILPGIPTYFKVPPGAHTYSKVPPGAHTYSKVPPGAPNYSKVPPGAPNYSKVPQVPLITLSFPRCPYCGGVQTAVL